MGFSSTLSEVIIVIVSVVLASGVSGYVVYTDSPRFLGSSYLMETKILPFRGWGRERLPDLYEEMRRRAEIVRCLRERYPSYLDVWRTVIAVERVGWNPSTKRLEARYFTLASKSIEVESLDSGSIRFSSPVSTSPSISNPESPWPMTTLI